MKNNKILISLFAISSLLAGCQTVQVAKDAAVLDVSFQWSGKSGCSSTSPAMTVDNVPAGTQFLDIKLTDLDKPGYNHGGGIISYNGRNIPEGVLRERYTGPCPPMGSHTYEFTVMALDSDKSVAIGKGSAKKKYPE